MIRLIMKVPTGLSLSLLTQEQQTAISSVFASFVNPMIGTISYGTDTYTVVIPEHTVDGVIVPEETLTLTGKSIIDATVHDNFDPAVITSLGLPFEIIGSWKWEGGALTTIIPLDASFINYLPPTPIYNTAGEQTGTTPPVLHIPHNWAGWPEVVL